MVAVLVRWDAVRYIRLMPYSPFDPARIDAKRRRFRLIPVRTLVPNLITLLALCAGLTAIRLSVEDKLEWAVAAIVFAALLDGIDGRVARMLKGTSRFGAELDSLADFVNFGVAPALILYFWGLHELGNAGWIAAMVFAISTGLRFTWQSNTLMKIETRGSGRSPSSRSFGGTALVMRLTRPSAGDTTMPSRTGVTRSGSRKK